MTKNKLKANMLELLKKIPFDKIEAFYREYLK